MGTDAEGLVIHALSKALSIRLRIVYLHRDSALGYYNYPADSDEPCHVHLLLSPGHYDLLYPALPTAWEGVASSPRPVEGGIAAAPALGTLGPTEESLQAGRGEHVALGLTAASYTRTNAESPSDTGASAESCLPGGGGADLTTPLTNTEADPGLGATNTVAEGVVDSVSATVTDTCNKADPPSGTGADVESCLATSGVADLNAVTEAWAVHAVETPASNSEHSADAASEAVAGVLVDTYVDSSSTCTEAEVARAAVPEADAVIEAGSHTSRELIGESGGVVGVGALPLTEKVEMGDMEARVQLWERDTCRKRKGNGCPKRKNLEKYLALNPQCEVYRAQDKLISTPPPPHEVPLADPSSDTLSICAAPRGWGNSLSVTHAYAIAPGEDSFFFAVIAGVSLQPPPRRADGNVGPSPVDTLGRLLAPSASDTEADGASYQEGMTEVMDWMKLPPQDRVEALNSGLIRKHSQLVRELALRVASSCAGGIALPGIAGITSGSSDITEATISAVAAGLGVSIILLGSEVGKAVMYGDRTNELPFFVLYSPIHGEYTCLIVNALPVFAELQMRSFPPLPPVSWPADLAGSSTLTSTSPGKRAHGEVPL